VYIIKIYNETLSDAMHSLAGTIDYTTIFYIYIYATHTHILFLRILFIIYRLIFYYTFDNNDMIEQQYFLLRIEMLYFLTRIKLKPEVLRFFLVKKHQL